MPDISATAISRSIRYMKSVQVILYPRLNDRYHTL